MVLGSRVGKDFQLSGKLLFIQIGGAQPWPRRFPQPFSSKELDSAGMPLQARMQH